MKCYDMKKHLFSLIGLVALFCLGACSKNDEVPAETALSIVESYLPCTVSFNSSDSEWMDKVNGWRGKEFVVNNPTELPDDPIGFSDAYTKVNFNEYTLLLQYQVHRWKIDTYRTRYYINNIEGTYNWTISVGTSTVPDDNAEPLYFTRYAILVHKLPKDAKLQMWFSLNDISRN